MPDHQNHHHHHSTILGKRPNIVRGLSILSGMASSGQTINDRLNAVRYALVGQGLARTVCKASTEEVLGPKRKHIEYLIACTNEPNVSIPQLANLLIERTQHSSWAVVFKSLISIHHLMSYGNDRFSQYLATSNHSFELADFMDRTTPQGYNMSTFVRHYAKYINEKSLSYRALAVDVCKVRSCKQLPLRTMNMDNLSKNMPIIESQMDALLDFNATAKDLNNGIIKSAFRLLYKDLVRLYIAYQEAIINLMERFFKLNRKRTRDAYELYKRFIKRMERIDEFLQLVGEVGLDKSEMPDLFKMPSSLLPALEHHLEELEAKKRGAGATTSPELRADDDEETENKENELDSSQATEEEPRPTDAPAADSGSDGRKPPQADPSTSQIEPERQAPPQKPARPSPKTSPKVSPSQPKPPESSKPTVQTPQPTAAASAPPKKAAPPERPAKPPSRPPPPSAIASAVPAAPAPTGSSTISTEAQGSSNSGADGRGDLSQTKVVAHTPPPPHPPPPHPAPPAHPPSQAPSTQPISNENCSNNSVSTSAIAPEAGAINNEPPRDEADSSANTTSACSAGAHASETEGTSNNNDATTTQTNHTNESSSSGTAQEEEQEGEANHVNNNVRVEEAAVGNMPPPPPPIDDDVEPPPPLPEPVAEAQEEPQVEPVANGQSNNEVA